MEERICEIEGCNNLGMIVSSTNKRRPRCGSCYRGKTPDKRKGSRGVILGVPRICSFEGCENPIHSRGLCSGHRIQRDNGQELRPLRELNFYTEKDICAVDGCGETVYSKFMCRSHYDRVKHTERMSTDPSYVVKKLERSRKAHQKEDPKKRAEQNLAWCRANKESRRESHRRWEAVHKGASIVEKFTKQQVWEEDEGMCGICGDPADKNNWHLDHIIPLSRGGQHTRENVQVSHPFCNLSKKDLLMSEYLERRSQWDAQRQAHVPPS